MNETEYELRGFYKPHFFSIYLNGEFNSDIQKLSKKDLGTFVHEYTHYLQNVTTIFGLINSTLYFNYLFEVKKFINANSSLKIPLKDIPFSEAIRKGKMVFDRHYGTTDSFSIEYDSLKVYVEDFSDEASSFKTVMLDLFLKDEKIITIFIGNLIVKEGMARLCQLYFDEEVEHPTFPYKGVEILCEILNPELLQDKRKLIAICSLALNSQNSGLTLYELLIEVRTEPNLNGIEIFKKYQSERWIVHKNEKITIQKFLLNAIEEFKVVLSSSIYAELYHFEKLLENIKLSVEKDTSPLLDIMYSENDKIAKLKYLIDVYGIPHIRDKNGFEFYPLGSKNGEEDNPALEFLDLLGQRLVIERILGFNQDTICSLYPQCQLSETRITDENCFDSQWKRENPCAFKIVSDNWKLNEKIKSV